MDELLRRRARPAVLYRLPDLGPHVPERRRRWPIASLLVWLLCVCAGGALMGILVAYTIGAIGPWLAGCMFIATVVWDRLAAWRKGRL